MRSNSCVSGEFYQAAATRYAGAVLILLPPSEGKTAATSGTPVSLDALSHPSLNATRESIARELAEVSAAPNALEQLGVGASLVEEVARNTQLDCEPATYGRDVYSGVLYEALGFASLTKKQLALADASVRVVSGLWGLVAPSDKIPAYRLSMGVSLGKLGKLSTQWKKVLDAELAPLARGSVIVDCRSATYVAAWKPAATLDTQWVTVKVLRDLNGKRTVVSHNAKHARGILARHLLIRRGAAPKTAEQLLKAARECDHFIEATLIKGKANAYTLELVVL